MIDGKGIRGWKESNRGESKYVNKCNEWKERKKKERKKKEQTLG